MICAKIGKDDKDEEEEEEEEVEDDGINCGR